ncbi:GrpB family protein [Desulfitobacterium metallireducens]|uniref:GrpB family protein n=1 Tax=Desulfitobacterium metallireducens TaxID=142877 RepID=UPI0006844E1A
MLSSKLEGLLVRVVVVNDYNYQWPSMFKVEADKICEVFGEELIAVHHIGSTSVPGIKAKPIIDIMPLVRDIEVVDKFNDRMIALGYEPMGEFGIPKRRFFYKGGEDRTHHIHIFEYGSIGAERHLAFRDFLRKHENDAKEYSLLKELLAKRFPNDIEGYIDGKNDFVKSLEQKAIKWYRD